MKLFLTATYPQMLEVALQQIDRTRGQKTCIVVPDRFSLEAEEALLREMGGTTFDVEVTTFARLADKLTGEDKITLTAEGSAVVVASLMQKHADKLQAFRGTACAGELCSTIAQLMSCGIAPDKLTYESEDALARKIHDIKLIYAAYEEFLGKDYRDASSKMREAIRAVDQPWVRDTHFIFAGYDAVTGLNATFVAALSKVAGKVVFCLTDADYLFGSTQTERKLANIATAVERVDAECSPLRTSFLRAFGDGTKKDTKALVAGTGELVRLHVAAGGDDVFDHCAKTIIARVRRDGLRYKDVAVVTSVADEASRFLDGYGIPYNTDSVLNLSVHPLARVLSDALECVTKRYATPAMAKLAHNPELGVTDEAFFAWDSYVRRFGLDRNAHLSPYTAVLPQGVGKESERKQVEADRVHAETVRKRVCAIVSAIPAGLQPASVFADALKKILASLPELTSVAKVKDAYLAFDRQARERIEKILDNFYFVDGAVDAEQCAKLFATGLLATDVRVTPTFVDAVNVFTPDSFGFGRYKLLIWLGADEGSLPAVQHDCGLLSDQEIDRLGDIEGGINPKISEVNARARMRAFSTLFLSDEVTLMTSGGVAQPNFVFRILRDEYGVPVTTTEDFEAYAEAQTGTRQQFTCLFHAPDLRNAKRTFYELYHRACASGAERVCPSADSLAGAADITVTDYTVQNVEQAEQVFFRYGQTSISQIEKYFGCPYSHFLAYGLRCKPRKEAKVKASDIGNVLHAVAEVFAANLPARREDCAARSVVLTEQVLASDEIFGLNSAETEHERKVIFEESKVMCERLYDFAQSTEFVFKGAEQNFGTDKAQYPALDVGVKLTGKIDRIDTCDDGVMIIDYKTGYSAFDLNDVFYGKQIQLFSYMRVLTKLGYKPSAAIFFPVRNDFKDELTGGGWVSSEYNDLAKLDKAFTSQSSSGFLPVAYSGINKETREIKLKNKERALSQMEWEEWLSYTEKLLTQAVKEIKDGYVAPVPFEADMRKNCQFCDGAQSCPNAGRYGLRTHNKTVKKVSIAPMREKEVD